MDDRISSNILWKISVQIKNKGNTGLQANVDGS
jgi:hypothetical protein